jgi:hypothetical protein
MQKEEFSTYNRDLLALILQTPFSRKLKKGA